MSPDQASADAERGAGVVAPLSQGAFPGRDPASRSPCSRHGSNGPRHRARARVRRRAGGACDQPALRRCPSRTSIGTSARCMAGWPFSRLVARRRRASRTAVPRTPANPALALLVLEVGARASVPQTQFGLTDGARTVWCDLRVGRHVVEFDGRVEVRAASTREDWPRARPQVLWDEKEAPDFVMRLQARDVSRDLCPTLASGRACGTGALGPRVCRHRVTLRHLDLRPGAVHRPARLRLIGNAATIALAGPAIAGPQAIVCAALPRTRPPRAELRRRGRCRSSGGSRRPRRCGRSCRPRRPCPRRGGRRPSCCRPRRRP